MQNHCSIEHVVLLIMKKKTESLVTEDKAKTLGKRKSSLRGFLSCHFSFPCLYRIRSYNFICMVFLHPTTLFRDDSRMGNTYIDV